MPPKKSGAQRRKQQKDVSKLIEDPIVQDPCPAEVRGFEGLEGFKKVLLKFPECENPPDFPPVKKPTESEEGLQELADELQLPRGYDLNVLAEASRQTQRLEKLDDDGVPEVDQDVGLPFLFGLMEQYLRVDLLDGRTIVGQMKGVDREANLLLNHSREYWRDEDSDDFTSACLDSRRTLGTIMIPGKCVQNVCLVQHSGSARSIKKSVDYIEHMIGTFKKQKSQIDAAEEARRQGKFEKHTSFIPQKIEHWNRNVEVLATEDNIKFARQTHGRVMNSGGFNIEVFEQGIIGFPAETKEDPGDPEQGETSQAAAARVENIKRAEELRAKKQFVLELMKKRQQEEKESRNSVFA